MAASDITILSGVPTFTYTSGGIHTRCTLLTCPLLSLLPSLGRIILYYSTPGLIARVAGDFDNINKPCTWAVPLDSVG